jgi:hypothetical protein
MQGVISKWNTHKLQVCQAGAKQLVFTDQNDGGDSGGNLASVTQTGMVNGRHTSRRK